MIKIEPIFSVPLIQVNWKDSKNHNKKISDWCLQYEKDNPPTSEKINRFPGSYNYYSDMFVKDENRVEMINQPEFKEFSQFLIQTNLAVSLVLRVTLLQWSSTPLMKK